MEVLDFITQRITEKMEAEKKAFEPKLIEIGLGQKQIASASLPELEQLLERINKHIEHPDSLQTTESQIGLGILSLLFQRKKLILDRIAILTGKEKVEGLRSVAARADPAVSDELQHKISDLEAEAKKWRDQIVAADDAQRKANFEQQAELARTEVFERRSRVWQVFLERQSVATIVGAILLIAIFVFIAISAALGTIVPELISNAFLVILGYFFGQASSEVAQKSKGTKGGE